MKPRGRARDHTTCTAGAGDQTLPLWIFTNLTLPNQAPVVNISAVLQILISVVPIWLAQRLSEATLRGGAGRRPAEVIGLGWNDART